METPPYLHDMEQRLQALERANSRLKTWIVLVLFCALGAGALAGYPLIEAGSSRERLEVSRVGERRGKRRPARRRGSPAAYS